MAYSMDFVCEASYALFDGKPITKHMSHVYLLQGKEVTHRNFEVFRITFKNKNMNAALDAWQEWVQSSEGKLSMSIALSEFGIHNGNGDETHYVSYRKEKTPKK